MRCPRQTAEVFPQQYPLLGLAKLFRSQNRVTMNLHASYWRYDGNHPNGKDCERNDPHGFGIALISYLAYIADGGAYGKLTQ